MSTITNNKLTDERPDDECLEILITTRREIAERHASEGRMGQCAVHTLILNALLELQERRKADSAEPAGYHVIKECGKVGCSVATLEESEKTRDFWNKRWAIRPYFYTPPDLYALCWKPGDVVTYTPDPEKATIWLNNYSGTCVQEYVNLERLQEDTKHGLLEVAIARFSKMNEGFPIKRFKADWVISWMLENFPPIAQKQGDN